jgi:hypothetical protein
LRRFRRRGSLLEIHIDAEEESEKIFTEEVAE